MAHRDTKRRTISRKQRLGVLQADGYVCGYCPTRKRRKPASLVVDHIVPVRDGGYHGSVNWVTSCRSCNRLKWHHNPNEKGAPKLRWFRGRAVAKVTTIGVKFRKRVPKISFRRIPTARKRQPSHDAAGLCLLSRRPISAHLPHND
jgi:5-methylcytosine-specific restriction endonuclease McrA